MAFLLFCAAAAALVQLALLSAPAKCRFLRTLLLPLLACLPLGAVLLTAFVCDNLFERICRSGS